NGHMSTPRKETACTGCTISGSSASARRRCGNEPRRSSRWTPAGRRSSSGSSSCSSPHGPRPRERTGPRRPRTGEGLFHEAIGSRSSRPEGGDMEPTVITSPAAPPPGGPYSPGLVLGDMVLLAGQGGKDPATGTMGATIEEQTEQTLNNIATLLEV